MPDAKDIKEREDLAFHETCKDYKAHYERKGDYRRTGEQIEREVKKELEQIYRERDHAIYKGK